MTKNIAIIGSGYVGLVSALCFAESGHQVTAIDVDEAKIKQLEGGKPTIYEPGLQELLTKNLAIGSINFTTDYAAGLKDKEICLIAVGTPHDDKTNEPNLTYLNQALEDVLANLSGDILLINKSTVPLGTALKMQLTIDAKKLTYRVSMASNPEFLSQGRAVKDFMHPRRVVVGTSNKTDEKLLYALYKPFIDAGYPFMATDIASAELIKYAANSFLAMKVAFINEVAEIASQTGANIKDISFALGLDDRIGKRFLDSGPGYGGSCFPKDTRALRKSAAELQLELPLVANIDISNEKTIERIADKIIKLLKDNNVKKLGVLGAAFKAGTDDTRDSQALKLIDFIKKTGLEVDITLQDPFALAAVPDDLDVLKTTDMEAAIAESEMVCVVTEWKEYQELDKKIWQNKIVVDLRNILTKLRGSEKYYELGRNF